ncbi:cysteine hydrolase family protein [Nocardia camponoti]|uniref:Isochorismatase n=1 Tax=Nocardia camponoti TaxID=1616106 RepID=A0A917QJY4_9NOCA|nr:cysteine hydrolase family protein [Nocardia camponoti]GGK52783.1 isochorismatase [Nocardia camponoti]
MTSTTLRELNAFDSTPAVLADSTLILIDYQNTYTQGVMELDGWESALTSAAELLSRAREVGAKVIHVINDGGPGTPYDIRETIGQIHPQVSPIEGESVVVKQVPNAFINTELADLLDTDSVVIAGFMTHMCVAFTTQGAFLNGNKPTVVASASATRPLSTVAGGVTSDELHRGALATIGDLYGVVVEKPADLG